jgi:Domain of unknown function (DUF4214)
MKEVPRPVTSARTMESLLRLYDEAFVTSAYKAILGRTPDPDGLQNYLTQVRGGVEKTHILAELSRSPEGRAKRLESPALRGEITFYTKRAASLWVRLLRRISNASTNSTQRQLRIVENQLYLLERELARQNKELGELLTYVMSINAKSVNPSACPNDSSNEHSINNSYPFNLSPDLARTFVELKAAIALRQTE